MKTQKSMVDTPVIISGLVLILVIGFFVSIGVGLNQKVSNSIGSDLTGDALAVKNNASKSVNDSYQLAANLPLIIVAVLMIMVLLGIGYSIM